MRPYAFEWNPSRLKRVDLFQKVVHILNSQCTAVTLQPCMKLMSMAEFHITNAGEGSGPDMIQGLYESSGLSVSKSDAWSCNVMKIMYKKYMKCEELQMVLQLSPVVCGEDMSCIPFVFIIWHYCDVEVGLVACLWKSTKRTGTNGA